MTYFRARQTLGKIVINKDTDSERTGEFNMPRGKVKWFNNAKGYGFIIEEGCSDDLFAHFSSVQMDGYKTLKAGQPVTFDKKPSDKGVHAVNIVPEEQPKKQDSPESSAEPKPAISDAGENQGADYPGQPRTASG
ncbi:cold-shock protein [Marinobacter orientalis]|uniref:Cold shock domain-containing protein n=2 Tax=Marinobacter orientalis TaxID=1928859 RepID=A0A7Y0WSI9_9GAMM|nr:cold shock domain-containing protein [Marinobacter orientalis]TGX50036.1 cold-shock protein [Marinobacter orientalis]